MAKEIERKFRVKSNAYRNTGERKYYKQGYLSTDKGRTVRIRIVDNQGYITVKGAAQSLSRDEYEYAIPATDANEMLDNLCLKPLIEKYRYRVPYAGMVWEVDEFLRENSGLIVAEIEIPAEDHPFCIPDWIGKEVTNDRKYFNSCLVQRPYSAWEKDDD